MNVVTDIINQGVRAAFSDAALQYDILTSMHKEIGKELIQKIMPLEQCDHILDVGMGTGKITRRLHFYFPDSHIVGMDFADGMIQKAQQDNQGFDIISGDASILPFKDKTFDIVFSNLAYQWVTNLPGAFKQSFNSLKDKGTICFTMFGYNTLDELFMALEDVLKEKKNNFALKRLAKLEEVQKALDAAGFQHIEADYEIIKVHFPSLMDLLRWVRDIGANSLRKEFYLGKNTLERVNEIFETKFKDRFGIYTTFEILWLNAKK